MSLQQTSFERILQREGGTQNSPIDRDGPLPTRYGVTAGLYSDFLGRPATADDILRVTPDLACRVYAFDCARVGLGDATITHPALAEQLYDAAVHHGAVRAVKFMQTALATVGRPVAVDGSLGPRTRAALEACSPLELHALALAVFAERLVFLGRLITKDPTQAGNAWGWCRRLAGVLLTAEGVRA